MVDIKIIDNLLITPSTVDPNYNTCSIYFRDDNNHRWLLYAGKVEKGIQIEQIMDSFEYAISSPITTTNLTVRIDSYKPSGLIFSLHDLEASYTSKLYNDMKAVLDKYKNLTSI